VAGSAPTLVTAHSAARATSRFRGRGNPWVMSVDSRATMGLPAARAADTSPRTASAAPPGARAVGDRDELDTPKG